MSGEEREPDDVEFEQRLSDLRGRLSRGVAASETEPLDDEPTAYADALDGLIRVEALAGKLLSVRLDGRVIRLSATRLSDSLTAAANAALERAASEPSAGEDAVVDLDALAEQLREVQNEGLRRMELITQGIHQALAAIRQNATVRGDIDDGGLEFLLDEALRNIDEIRRPRPASGSEQVEQDPYAASGLDNTIRVVAESGSRLAAIEISERAMRRASQDIAAETIRTANNALQTARDAAVSRLRRAGAELGTSVAQVQDMSLSQMKIFTTSLNALMTTGIEPD
jgi:hypothetical protein